MTTARRGSDPFAHVARSTGGGTIHATELALQMLDVFASVGGRQFEVTFTGATGSKLDFHGSRRLDELRHAIPTILDEATEHHHNVIVRPRSTEAVLMQLDDLDEVAAAKLRPVSFLVLRTSPGNYQVWLAVPDGDSDFARRLRKGVGADPTASGATRVSGSLNFKEKYAPAYPCVQTVHAAPGRLVTRAELETLGVVADPEQAPPKAVSNPRRRAGAQDWPNYQRCVDNAPPARGEDHPDISRADFTFCLLAIDWGRGVEETAVRLMQESNKASENGEAYARRTALNAAAVVERRRGPQR